MAMTLCFHVLQDSKNHMLRRWHTYSLDRIPFEDKNSNHGNCQQRYTEIILLLVLLDISWRLFHSKWNIYVKTWTL